MSNINRIFLIALMLILSANNAFAAASKVILTFDDGWSSQYYKAFPIMQANNQRGTAFIITGEVAGASGKTGMEYMNISQLRALYSAGWDLSSHTVTHPHLTQQSINIMNSELSASQKWLITSGFQRGAKFLAYPYGEYNSKVISAVKANGYLAARTVDDNGGLYPKYTLADPNVFSMATLMIGGIPGYGNPATPPSYVQKKINETIAAKGLLIISFHIIEDACCVKSSNAPEEYKTADFKTISDFLKIKQEDGELDVVTMSEYFGTVSEPTPVATPIPMPGTPIVTPNVTSSPTTNVTSSPTTTSTVAPVPNTSLTYIPPIPINMTSGSENLTWGPGSGNTTDFYNFSVNGTWYNGSVTTFYDTAGLTPGTYTVNVYAVNSTNGTTMNNTPLIMTAVKLPTYIPPIPNISRNIGDSWINTSWYPGDGNKTDLYNININGVWTNGTANTSFNSTNLSGGSNVLANVYAVNITNGISVNNIPATLNSTIPVPVETPKIPPPNGGNSGSVGSFSSGGGSSGSGGDSGSGFDPNAEFFERSDTDIHNGVKSVIPFTKNGLVSEITVEGIKNYGDITAVVSILKNNPTNVTIDNVYKFFSVKMGTIKHDNEKLFFKNPTIAISLNKSNIGNKIIKVYEFKNGSWIPIDIEDLIRSEGYRNFKLNVDELSNFVIEFEPESAVTATNLPNVTIEQTQAPQAPQTPQKPTSNPKEIPGFEIALVIAAIATYRIIKRLM